MAQVPGVVACAWVPVSVSGRVMAGRSSPFATGLEIAGALLLMLHPLSEFRVLFRRSVLRIGWWLCPLRQVWRGRIGRPTRKRTAQLPCRLRDLV